MEQEVEFAVVVPSVVAISVSEGRSLDESFTFIITYAFLGFFTFFFLFLPLSPFPF